MLRKTSATLANEVTGDFYAVSKLMDHSSPNVTLRYVTQTPDEQGLADIEWRRPDGQAIKLRNAVSAPVRPGPNWFIPFDDLALAVDPQTGKALYFARHIESGFGNWATAAVEIPKHGGVYNQPVPIPIPFKNGKPKQLAPAGNERFHALVADRSDLIYLTYAAGSWTAPARIGEYGTPSLFLIDDDSIQLASDGRNQALAIWPKQAGALVGRWIRLDETSR